MVIEILAKHMAAENQDYISQVPLQIKVAMWLYSHKWDVMGVSQSKLYEASLRRQLALYLFFIPPSIPLPGGWMLTWPWGMGPHPGDRQALSWREIEPLRTGHCGPHSLTGVTRSQSRLSGMQHTHEHWEAGSTHPPESANLQILT